MAKSKKNMYRAEFQILWESDIIRCTSGKTIKLKVVDCSPSSPTLWIDTSDGNFITRTFMTLENLREIKRVIEVAETPLIELTERYEAMKPPILKHTFYGKCLLCFSDLRQTETQNEFHESSICDECCFTMMRGHIEDQWHEACQGCKSKAEVAVKLETDVLFRDNFNKYRNQILQLKGVVFQ